MGSLSAGVFIEDLTEDLQLHQVLLQSLEEERPDAIAERQELLDTIHRLESQLAQLRADRPQSPRPNTSSSDRFLPLWSQVDGGFDLEPFDATESSFSGMSPPARPSQLLQTLPTRKRQAQDAELEDTSEAVSKRNTPLHHRSASATPSVASTSSGSDGLHKLLGFDSHASFLAMQEEQREAEQWLEDRKEQERRDYEFARMVQQGLYEPASRPQSSQSSPSYTRADSLREPVNQSGDSANQSWDLSVPNPVSQTPAGTNAGLMSQFPSCRSLGSLNSRLEHPAHAASGRSLPKQQKQELYDPLSIQLPDSEDSDLAEISSVDFNRNVHSTAKPFSASPWPTKSYSWLNNGMPGPATGGFPVGQHPVPGPSASGTSTTVYGPNILQNTWARLNAGTSMLANAGQYFRQGISEPLSAAINALGSHADPFVGPRGDDDFWSVAGTSEVEDIKQLLDNIRPDVRFSKEDREGTPDALQYPLMLHQKGGVTWMKSMEESEQKGGILADSMGLGKTIQALALIVSRSSSDPDHKSTLIITPTSLMLQWKREIETKIKREHRLSVFILHGLKAPVSFKDLNGYDVVLTTYGTLAMEYGRLKTLEEELASGATGPHASNSVSLPILGANSKWYRVILDEAQSIKNRNTKSALACCRVNATYRWCMTGTPMMNSVKELHSLLKFLRIRPYNNLEIFNHTFTRPLEGSSSQSQKNKARTQLQALLSAILLRRTKTSKIDGEPILQLPPRFVEKVHAVFSEDEQELYKALETKTQLVVNRYLKQGTVGKHYSHVLVLLLRLRQACCHPHLMSDFSVEASATANTDGVDLAKNAEQFSQQVILRLKDDDNLECPICIDAVENPMIFFPCGHGTCSECFSRMTDPAVAIRQGNDGEVRVKCPNCRAQINPKQITDRNNFRKVHYGEEFGDADQDEKLPQPTEDEGDNDTESESESDDDDDSLSRFIADDDEFDDEHEAASGKKSKAKGKKPSKGKNAKMSLAQLKKEASKNQTARRKYLRRLEKSWVSSAKIDKALEILEAIESRGEGEKTIIFSQFTSLLDLLEVPIVRKGWGYRRYDGSMRPAERNDSVIEFTDNPNCKILLVSLKAGNSGLNLVAASHVIIFDPFWNPYVEEQAIDRAHRIGQLRPVSVHRILVQNTVEDRILELQEKKRELIEGALDEKAASSVSRLGYSELANLFGITN